jgi:hypothetical protein
MTAFEGYYPIDHDDLGQAVAQMDTEMNPALHRQD